ncbi:hypothetical protein Pmani_017223 [Petrolisthes manimaculis]|uniref:Innexin n=1 Tax=Petrolisthes manimaculis TaxID=1843537 RepID=A0AAE1PPY7_9EUCA|nr:hypothetical protein Pmani_017223 [Petrolisthes manimaculis]
MVFKVVASLAGLVKVRLLHTEIDNLIFRLHYRWSASYCFLACALVAASDYIGGAIQCVDGSGGKVPDAVNTYCWIKSTYTINDTISGYHYGLGTQDKDHVRVEHAYYQWVPFVLFLQGCLFYLPHLVWKMFEGKTADKLLQGLQFNSMDESRDEKKKNIIKYLHISAGHNGRYSVIYMACELLNFVNVIGQMFLLDKFFGGIFMTFGSKVMEFALEDEYERSDPMVMAFPRMTKCDFHTFGPSGTLQLKDALCVLPQNILNEKVFITMWFWFVLLASITALQVVWRVVVAVSPIVRVRLLEVRGKISASPSLEMGIRHLHLGDYFLIDILGRNLDAFNFKDILLGVTGASEDKHSYKQYYENDDDDDPISLKRQMEREEENTTAV